MELDALVKYLVVCVASLHILCEMRLFILYHYIHSFKRKHLVAMAFREVKLMHHPL